jgi:diguanylate cyclase (GGDEF)-like protein
MPATLAIHTIRVEHAFLLAVNALLTLVNGRMHKGVRGIYWFALYNVLAFTGSALVATRGHLHPLLSVVLADLLVLAAYIPLLVSIASFYTAPLTSLYFQLGAIASASVLLFRYGWLDPDPAGLLLTYSFTLGSIQAHAAWFIFRNDKPRSDAGASMAVFLALPCLLNLVRIATVLVQALLHGTPLDSGTTSGNFAWFVLINTALQCGVMVSYVWMTASFLQKDLAIQASTDCLTGVLNRRALNLAAERVFARSGPGECASAIALDLDDFKKINDSCGHGSGDAALVALATCLHQGLREGDCLGRMGGDEFVILLPHTSLATARMIAVRLDQLVRSADVVYHQHHIRLSASFGVAQMTYPHGNWDHLLRECDKLLYAAKRSRPRVTSLALEQFFPSSDELLLHPQSFAVSRLEQSS